MVRLIYFMIVLVCLGLLACSKKPETNATTTTQPPLVNELPMLNVVDEKGAKNSIHDAEENSIIIFFNPGCDHCQREATEISENKNIFKEYELYFVSVDSMENILKFALEYKLTEERFHFCQATGPDVYYSVGALPSVPAIFIYRNRKLVKRFDGETKLEELKKFL